MTITIPSHLTDDELVAALPDLAGDERLVSARLVAHLAEVDKRQLFAPMAYSSLYMYCRAPASGPQHRWDTRRSRDYRPGRRGRNCRRRSDPR